MIRIACAAVSCSACDNRSAAIHAGSFFGVGDDQDLGRPGDHVDADAAEDTPLGRRDIGVARADDLVDRRDRRGAVGQRRHRLRPADPVDFVDAEQVRAAASTSGFSTPPGAGTVMTRRPTPATFAGIAFISTEDG